MSKKRQYKKLLRKLLGDPNNIKMPVDGYSCIDMTKDEIEQAFIVANPSFSIEKIRAVFTDYLPPCKEATDNLPKYIQFHEINDASKTWRELMNICIEHNPDLSIKDINSFLQSVALNETIERWSVQEKNVHYLK